MAIPVQVKIGDEVYDLIFTPRDMFDIDGALGRSGLAPLAVLIEHMQALQRLDVLAVLLNFGLKRPGVIGPNGEYTRILGEFDSFTKAVDLIRRYTKGKPAVFLVILSNTVFEALAQEEWFNLKEVSDAAHAEQEKRAKSEQPPKNSGGPGSKHKDR